MLEKTDEEAELEKSSDVLKTGRALTVEEEEGDGVGRGRGRGGFESFAGLLALFVCFVHIAMSGPVL